MLEKLPVLMLKKIVLLPYQEIRLELSNTSSKKVIDLSYNKYDKKILVICPNNLLESSLDENDLPNIGVIGKIKSKIVLPNGNYRVIINGLNRVIVNKYMNSEIDKDILDSIVKMIYIDNSIEEDETPILKTLKSVINKYIKTNPQASNSVSSTVANITDLDMLTDVITNFLPLDMKRKVNYMNEFDYVKRANDLIKDINIELEVLNIESKIDDEIRVTFEKEQRDYILRQKISKLNEQLGIVADKQTEISKLSNKINELDILEKTKLKLMDELYRYTYTSENNPESSVIRNYLDTVLSLPWNKYSDDEKDLKKIKKNFDKTHFGLENVKQRIVEYIAVKNNNEDVSSPIICLVGPPGVGKTTFCSSIADCLKREFYKISVGGLNDPAELIGHKRTYLGSTPGKIISGIKRCNTSNPVILIDEVDKIKSDFKGDPSAVLLDILDPAQNNKFIDNYIEEPFDLSKVLFILTANDINEIPNALKDRLEIIEINSYTENEKLTILKKYIIPKIMKEYNTKRINISDDALLEIISTYTNEAGIREAERLIRKIYRYYLINEYDNKRLNIDNIKNILGNPKYNKYKKKNHIGSSSTLGVSSSGGIIIGFESILLPGSSKLVVTGNINDIVIDSANIALHYVISRCKEFGIESKKINSNDIHINALNSGIKKNGSSGGAAITSSIVSLLLNKEIPSNVCFTGEISLHGDINEVGGIKEKLIGAYNNNYEIVYMPKDNEQDLELVPNEIIKKLDIRLVSNYDEIFDDLFKKHK